MPEKSRNWCFTLNNYTASELPELWTLTNIKLLVYQAEISESGTPHLQGYLELSGPRQLSYLRSLSDRAHWEQRKGTREEAMVYCMKTDTQASAPCLYWKKEWQTPNNEDLMQCSEWLRSLGITLTKRISSDSETKLRLEQIREKLQEGSTSIEEIADDEFDLWVRHYRAFEKYIVLKTEPRNFPVEVEVVQGPTGTGKSRWCMDNYPDAYWKQRSNWWDGYFKHKTVIIDEFYGWMPFDLLLRVCDRYPLLVETKGGQMQFIANKIIITTNHPPSSWYKSVYFPAFVRRVTKWHIMATLGEHTEYDTYEEALVHMERNILTF